MRTVFTDAQVKQLEALFDLTDYPPAEARAELARSSGLSEETVRVRLRDVTIALPFKTRILSRDERDRFKL